MSELAGLVGSPRSDVIPDYVMSPFQLFEFGECEEEFGRRHVSLAAAACDGADPSIRDTIVGVALNDVAVGSFNYGTVGFDARARAISSLPFLLYLSLRINHANITLAKASALLTPDNRMNVHRVVLSLMGYDKPVKKKPTPTETTTGTQTTEGQRSDGIQSGESSEKKDSPISTSGG